MEIVDPKRDHFGRDNRGGITIGHLIAVDRLPVVDDRSANRVPGGPQIEGLDLQLSVGGGHHLIDARAVTRDPRSPVRFPRDEGPRLVRV